ncbi:hypothetical protein ACFVJ5_01190 [Nocardia sp. NPDC127606]|uniref:hypothetical protein n=1 Tax=Nocardia sp. NPDC127606 TaxID=3345406 RepID=UPI0036389BDC
MSRPAPSRTIWRDPAATASATRSSRFWHENQPAFRDLGFGAGLRYQFRVLADLMTAPDAAALDIYHARQALLAISWSLSMMGDLELTDDQMHTAAMDIAIDILARIR